jgi:hypothetical protein
MKRTLQLISFLTILGVFLLSACGGQAPSVPGALPNADHLVTFDENGLAVLRGTFNGGGFGTDTSQGLKENIHFYIPAKVQGIESQIMIDLPLRFETEFSSSLHALSTVREYHIFHPYDHIQNAFPSGAQVDVTFRKKDAGVDVISMHEASPGFTLFKRKAAVDGVLSTNAFSEGVLAARTGGGVLGSTDANNSIMYFNFHAPITIQGIPATVVLRFYTAPDTQIITRKGAILSRDAATYPHGLLTIKFTRQGNKLIARQITELP